LQTPDSNTNLTKEPAWFQFKNLYINMDLFKKGIVAIVPSNTLNEYSSRLGKSSFFIKDRKFFIVNLKKGKDFKKGCSSSHSPLMPKEIRFVKRAQSIIDSLNKVTEKHEIQLSSPEDSTLVFTPKHKEEIFLPLIIKENQKQFGSYVYPWLSDNKSPINNEFKGFKQFVTAGCLFGAGIKGQDQNNAEFGLIKHDIQFFPGQKIERIEDLNLYPYERALFLELEKQLRAVKSLSESDQPDLLYHLPYYDYILYGVELFLREKITLPALNKFFEIILNKKEELIGKIRELCVRYKVNVKIESPFENLFGVLPTSNSIAHIIFDLLNIDLNEIDNEIKGKQNNEQKLVKNCLEKLQSNNINPEHRKVWQDFLKIDTSVEINNLEQLFKIANALMIGIAAKDKNNNETCSFLPVSEKQIQVGYAFYSKELSTISSEGKNPYPSIVNLTFLESVLAYSPASNGLLFYFGSYLKNLQDLIVKEQILSNSYQNVSFFANGIQKKNRLDFIQVPKKANGSNQNEPSNGNDQLTCATHLKQA
jgi:hypothetical protein